jgi:hypothetical protein
MPRMANESRLNKRQIAEFQARLERWLAELRVAADQMTREGRELVDESALDVADRAVNSASDRLMTVTGCCIWLKPLWTAFEMGILVNAWPAEA